MAACDIDVQIAAAACRNQPRLTEVQQKQLLLYSLWLTAIIEGASVPQNDIKDLIASAACWNTLTDAQVTAFKIQMAQNAFEGVAGIPFPDSDSTILATTSCLNGLGANQLDRIIDYLWCQVLSNVPSVV